MLLAVCTDPNLLQVVLIAKKIISSLIPKTSFDRMLPLCFKTDDSVFLFYQKSVFGPLY